MVRSAGSSIFEAVVGNVYTWYSSWMRFADEGLFLMGCLYGLTSFSFIAVVGASCGQRESNSCARMGNLHVCIRSFQIKGHRERIISIPYSLISANLK